MRCVRVACLAALMGLATGCTGLELPALGATMLTTGMGNAVRAGTEYTMTGTAYRTFTLSLEDLARVTRGTLERMDLPVTEAKVRGAELILVAEGIDREVRVRFTPISPAVTRLGISVKQGLVRRDRATGSEIVTQIEQSTVLLKSARR